jgi:hypothetical protein
MKTKLKNLKYLLIFFVIGVAAMLLFAYADSALSLREAILDRIFAILLAVVGVRILSRAPAIREQNLKLAHTFGEVPSAIFGFLGACALFFLLRYDFARDYTSHQEVFPNSFDWFYVPLALGFALLVSWLEYRDAKKIATN